VLPIAFDVSEKRIHDYVRRGTTTLFPALNVGTGEVYGECKATRSGADFLAFLKAAVKPSEGKDVHVVKTTSLAHHSRGGAGLAGQEPSGDVPLHADRLVLDQPNRNLVRRHYPPGIRPGTFASVRALVARIRDYIGHWNANPSPFVWTATAEILAKVRLV
jgi:hypothetical protein